jgi:hypothetical protein
MYCAPTIIEVAFCLALLYSAVGFVGLNAVWSRRYRHELLMLLPGVIICFVDQDVEPRLGLGRLSRVGQQLSRQI